MSIPKYLFLNFESILNLNVHGNRPFPIWIGGWNTYAFLLSLAFIIIYKYLSLSRIFKYSLLILVLGVMITTLSRGGVLALLVVLFLDWRSKIKSVRLTPFLRNFFVFIFILFIFLNAAILVGFGNTVINAIYDRFVVSFIESQYEGVDYLQSVSSARSVLWKDSLTKLINVEHSYQWLFGYGLGHYAYEAGVGFETEMCNQYLLFLYEYGLIVGLALSALMFRAYSRLRWRSNLPWTQTVKAMFAIYLLNNFVEGFIYTTQICWIIGFGAAIVLHVLRSDRMWLARLKDFGQGTGSSADFAMKAT